MRRKVSFFCQNFIGFNFPVLENNLMLHIVESVREFMAKLFSNSHAVPGLPISKLRPLETFLVFGNLLNIFLLETCIYHNIPNHRNCIGPL